MLSAWQPPRVLGIDPSLTGTGLALLSEGGPVLATLRPGKLRDHERMQWVLHELSDFIKPVVPDLVVIEGPSFGSTTGRPHERAGLWWMITRRLWLNSIPYAVMPPKTRALYATGNGNADKNLVIECMCARFPSVDIRDDNQADALAMAVAGADHLGVMVPEGPGRYRQALRKVVWPQLPSDEDGADG